MLDEFGHLTDETLIRYADDATSIDERPAVEGHVAVCAPCRRKLDDFRTLAAAMREEETWWLADELASEKGEQAIRDIVARMDAEDAEAERMLEPFLRSQYRFASKNIARRKRFQTGGVVRLLCRTAWEQCPREPLYAAALAETAYLIAEALPDTYYPQSTVNDLRGRAWKEYATASQYLGNFSSAFDALDRAERFYRRLPDPETQLATVDLCRAALFWEQGNDEEALRVARSAGKRFEERSDIQHYFDAREWEAIILHRLGRVDEACEILRNALELADMLGDAEMKARAAKNLGIAHRDRGDTASASKYLSLALQLFRGLDQEAMVVKTRWSIARLALSTGNAGVAVQQLAPVIADFERLGMAANTARAQLDLAEAFLLLHRYDEVEAVCAKLIGFFQRAKMLTGALTAAAYLKEATARRSITPGHIEHVRRYLSDLERAPDLPFAPPPHEIN